jgi:hypothetical protein
MGGRPKLRDGGVARQADGASLASWTSRTPRGRCRRSRPAAENTRTEPTTSHTSLTDVAVGRSPRHPAALNDGRYDARPSCADLGAADDSMRASSSDYLASGAHAPRACQPHQGRPPRRSPVPPPQGSHSHLRDRRRGLRDRVRWGAPSLRRQRPAGRTLRLLS